MSNQDSAGRPLDTLTAEMQAQQIQAWMRSLEALMQAVDASPMEAERKKEILFHMATIRNELSMGQWPNVGQAGAVEMLAGEVAEVETLAKDWQVLSMQLAQWIKTISDSLGIK